MFTQEQRARLRRELIEWAQTDQRIAAGAITGSAAANKEDVWSDIDLAFAVRAGEEIHEVLEDWTARMYSEHFAVHDTDVLFGTWTYRVFLLQSTLQEITRAFRAVLRTFLNEIRHANSKLADRLHPVLTSLSDKFEER